MAKFFKFQSYGQLPEGTTPTFGDTQIPISTLSDKLLIDGAENQLDPFIHFNNNRTQLVTYGHHATEYTMPI